jgi:transcriptional regulator with XRE-family HTH domain
MTGLTITQKKDWAKLLYTKENLTQAEIAGRVGVTRVTINKWINSESWEMLKVSITITKEEQLKNIYRQLVEINEVITGRDKGQRFATPPEADTISKLTKSIKQMETEVGLSDIISSFAGLIQFIRTYDAEQVEVFKPVLDAYVKSKLN